MATKQSKKFAKGKRVENTKKFYRPKETEKFVSEGRKEVTNDVSWYTKFPELAKSAGNIIYGQRMGDILDLGGNPSIPMAVPGIAKISLLPSIGISTDAGSPVNNMSRMIYSFIRHANSGSRNYEAPDYMTYLLAMGSAYAYYSSLVRLYGIYRTFSVQNKYVAKATVEALGFDYEDIATNLANLRYYINYYAARLNSFAVPKDMAYYDRMAFLPLHIFKDNEGDKCSFYVFDFDSLFVWDGIENASQLVTLDWGLVENKTLEDIKTVGEQIINALLSNEDIGIMSGDTLKAYGSANVRTVGTIDDTYCTLPVYSHDVSWQIHNARIYKLSPYIHDVVVTQENGYLVFNPTLEGFQGITFGPNGAVIDSDLETPDYAFNFENTRLHPTLNELGTALSSCGSEIPVKLTIYNFVADPELGLLTLSAFPVEDTIIEMPSYAPVDGDFTSLTMLSTFKLHPIGYLRLVATVNDQTYVASTSVYGDLNNYTQFGTLQAKQMHNAALMSLFQVPHMAQQAK